MGRLFIQAEDIIKAPWLLGNEELEQLDELIKDIGSRLEKASKKRNESTSEDRAIAPTTVKVVLTSTGKKNIEDHSIKGILKDVKAKDLTPTQLYIKIENTPGENEFRLVISSGSEGNLEYQLKCFDEDEELEIKYELDKWINKYKPWKAVQYWLEALPLIWLVGLFTLLVLSFNLYDSSSSYADHLSQKALTLIEKGIDSSNQNEAITILLQKEFGYTPKGFKIVETLNDDSLKNFVRCALLFIILILCPRSAIGIGKGSWKVAFFKFWRKLTLGLIPFSILLPKLMDLLTKYLF